MTMIFFAAHQKRQDTNNRERDMTDQDIDQVIKQAIDPSASHHARVALIPMLVAAIRAPQWQPIETVPNNQDIVVLDDEGEMTAYQAVFGGFVNSPDHHGDGLPLPVKWIALPPTE